MNCQGCDGAGPTRWYTDGGWLCRSCHPSTEVIRTDEVVCVVCGLGINPVFGIDAHYDCRRRSNA